MQQWLVSHVQSAHELQCWDLEREVERRDDGDGAVGPTDPIAGLSHMVSGVAEPTGQETDLIAAKVLYKGSNKEGHARFVKWE